MAELATVRAPNGTMFRVNAADAARWQAFLNDPAWASFTFDQGQSGGYNDRNIAGTNTPSQHAHGRAIDINWRDNPRGGDNRTTDDPTRQFNVVPADVARAVAARHGMVWGGEWSNPDPMHFELRRDGAPPPVGARTLVAHAGLTPPAPATQPAPTLGGGFPATQPPAAPATTPAPTTVAEAPAVTPEAPATAPNLATTLGNLFGPSETPAAAPKQSPAEQMRLAMEAATEGDTPLRMQSPKINMDRLRSLMQRQRGLGTMRG